MSGSRNLGPSYDEEKYWEEKFKQNADAFEWLGSGSILLDAFFNVHSSTRHAPRTLHLGAGTSRLSLDLARYYIKTYKASEDPLNKILNVDFSQTALTIGQEQATSEGVQGMQYLRIDLRNWIECRSLSFDGLLDFILDKSTSDAISTNPDVDLKNLDKDDRCPLLKEVASTPLDPLDLVAVHLAALSRRGCLWAVLSYSSSRFDIFTSQHCQSSTFWKILQQTPIPAPSGNAKANTPSVYHWFYLLQRL